MDLAEFVSILIIVGFLFLIGNNIIPMDRKIKQVINIIAVIVFVFWVGTLFGIFNSFRGIHIGN